MKTKSVTGKPCINCGKPKYWHTHAYQGAHLCPRRMKDRMHLPLSASVYTPAASDLRTEPSEVRPGPMIRSVCDGETGVDGAPCYGC